MPLKLLSRSILTLALLTVLSGTPVPSDAEVFYSKEKITEPPTGVLFLKGGVFRQVEGVALIKGGGQREAAVRFIAATPSPAAGGA